MNRKLTIAATSGIVALGLAGTALFASAANADPSDAHVSRVVPAHVSGAAPAVANPTSERSALEVYGAPPRETLGLAPADDPANARLDRCIADHSEPVTTAPTGSALTRPATAAEASRANRVEAFCAPLAPKPAWELDRSNPGALAFAEAVVAKLHAFGVTEVTIAPEDGDDRIGFAFGGAANDARSIELGMALLPKAELTVAGR